MASKQVDQCCLEKHVHEGTPVGKVSKIFNLDTYSVGEGENIIVIITDIYGFELVNTQLLADNFAKNGYKVLIPDILQGDPVVDQNLQDWLKIHTPEKTSADLDPFLKSVKSELKPKNLFGIGYCFGGKYTIQHLSQSGLLDAGAVAHPSFVSIDEVAAIKKPLLISAAETDPIFTTDLRHQTEAKLIEIGATYQLDLFSGVSHGFAVKGDISKDIVRYAKEKTVVDQVYWFNHHQK